MNTGSAVYTELRSFLSSGRLDEAELWASALATSEPENAAALDAVGVVHEARGRHAEAVAWHQRAIKAKPTAFEAFNHLGNAFQSLNRWSEAELCYRQAVALAPASSQALSNYAVAVRRQGRLNEALSLALAATANRPNDPDVLINCGVIARDCGQLDLASNCYERALDLDPDSVDGRWNLGIVRLLRGDLAALNTFELRWTHPGLACTPRHTECLAWDGTPLADRALLIYTEQGLGDSIQFVRFISRIERGVGKVYVECEESLRRLLETAPGIDGVFVRGDELPPFDVQAAMMSLGTLCRATSESIARPDAYFMLPQRRPVPRARRPLRVGLVWAGSPDQDKDWARSIRLDALCPVLEEPGIEWVSLQVGAARDEIVRLDRALASRLSDAGAGFTDFYDTALCVRTLDLVIAVDTAVAHLSGALDVPVWILLSTTPDWRWLAEGSRSSWYRSARLFRQHTFGDWSDTVEEVRAALQALASES